MMAYSEDHIALAAEYALGTLDADERAQVETMMSVDKDFTAMVEAWQQKLGVLNQMVGSVEPRPEVWDKIKTAIGHSEPQAPLVLPERAAAAAGSARGQRARRAASTPPTSSGCPHRARRWRNVATFDDARWPRHWSAMIATQLYQPDLLPDGLRPKVRTQVVEVKTPVAADAVGAICRRCCRRTAASPAFILTVDARDQELHGAQGRRHRRSPARAYELWLVSDKLQRPRSLGVIGGNDFTTRPVLASYDTDTMNKATYAVTVEPEGGSPTGVATGADRVYRQADRDRAAGRSGLRPLSLMQAPTPHKKKTPVGSGRFR